MISIIFHSTKLRTVSQEQHKRNYDRRRTQEKPPVYNALCFDADKHRKCPLAAWQPICSAAARSQSPKAAPRRAKGAGLDGEGADRAILHPPPT